MTRINDSSNQSVEQLKATTQQLALRVNQLERLLDGKEIDEVNFLDGMAHQRKTKFSLSNGMMKTDWKETDITATVTSSTNYTDFAFGFSISGAVVTVNSGKVRHGVRTAVPVTGGDITIGADQTWIFVAYTYGGAAVLASSTVEPIDTTEVHNHALHLWTLTDEVASIATGGIKHLGDIFIPGVFA